MERGPEQGLGRLVLKALAITSALTFLAIMMVNACLAPPRPAPVYAAPTKAAPVLPPGELHDTAAPAPTQAPPAEPEPVYAPATKSMTVLRPRPLTQAPPQQAPQQAPAPQQQGAR